MANCGECGILRESKMEQYSTRLILCHLSVDKIYAEMCHYVFIVLYTSCYALQIQLPENQPIIAINIRERKKRQDRDNDKLRNPNSFSNVISVTKPGKMKRKEHWGARGTC